MALVHGNLAGTKNGDETRHTGNKTFTIPVPIITDSEFILFNTSCLYRVASNPTSTQYTLSGSTVVLGLAPQINDNVWYYADGA